MKKINCWYLFPIIFLLLFNSYAFSAGSSSKSSRPVVNSPYDNAVKMVDAHNYQKAIGLLNNIVRKNPKNADAWNYLGFSQRKLKHYDISLDAYNKALAINPKHKGALEYLGELYLNTGHLDKAKLQLVKLDDVCGFFGCEEYSDLKSAIASYKVN